MHYVIGLGFVYGALVVASRYLVDGFTDFKKASTEEEKQSAVVEKETYKNQPYSTAKVGLITAGVVATAFLLTSKK